MLVLRGEVGRAELARLCAEVRLRLAAGADGVVVCDVARFDARGVGAVDVLARLQLTARRAGGRISLRGPAPGLRALLELTGLLGGRGIGFEPGGQPEEREPTGGVQEGVEPGDPAS